MTLFLFFAVESFVLNNYLDFAKVQLIFHAKRDECDNSIFYEYNVKEKNI